MADTFRSSIRYPKSVFSHTPPPKAILCVFLFHGQRGVKMKDSLSAYVCSSREYTGGGGGGEKGGSCFFHYLFSYVKSQRLKFFLF